MAYGIDGVNSISSISGVNSVYGIDSYRSYLTGVNTRRNTSLYNELFNEVASDVSTRVQHNSLKSSPSSYLTQLGDSINSMYSARAVTALNRKAVTSTNSSVISGTAHKNATAASYSIKVSKLASAQVNKGAGLTAAAPSVFNKGLHNIKIQNGTSEKNISFVVNESDTNQTALNKLSIAINKSNTGITASVETGSDNKVYLRLESAKTGTKNNFTLTDLNGNAVSAAGLNTVESSAQDAVYSIDGHQYTSHSNTVSLDNGKVQATLKKADETEVTLKVASDPTDSKATDYYTYLNNTLSTGNYNRISGIGTVLDMLL